MSLLLLILRGSGTSGLGDTSYDLKPNSLIKSSMASIMRFVVFWAMLSLLRSGGDFSAARWFGGKPMTGSLRGLLKKKSKYEADSLVPETVAKETR